MKSMYRNLLAGLLLVATLPVLADEASSNTSDDTPMQKVAKYLFNLGSYLGYNLSQPATGSGTGGQSNENNTVSQELISSVNAVSVAQLTMLETLLGAIPVNQSLSNMAIAYFVPTTSAYSPINRLANATFSVYSGASATADPQAMVTVSALIDQTPYQKDPVSQSILNILSTPDITYCMSYDQKSWTENCSYLYEYKVPMNIIGQLPDTYSYFKGSNNSQSVVNQLNSNALVAPMLYSTQVINTNPTSSSNSASATPSGLSAQSQAQEAENFIRYVSGGVAPLALPELKKYDQLYTKAMNLSKNYTWLDQIAAQATLANYLARLRVYAAQTSVAVGNLYYIMSKRLPQQGTAPGTTTSQALNEFAMATRRLYDPNQAQNQKTQWVQQINNASAASVQKEIALLLAEINYQLYLSRQQEERILMTNSILVIQNARNAQPNGDFQMSQP